MTGFDQQRVRHLTVILTFIARLITWVMAFLWAIPGLRFILFTNDLEMLTGSRHPDQGKLQLIGAVICIVGAIIGFIIGYLISLGFRVCAEMLRVQMQIEENTRKVAV